jgi:hypothetical protein
MDRVTSIDVLKNWGVLRNYVKELPGTIGNCSNCYRFGPFGTSCAKTSCTKEGKAFYFKAMVVSLNTVQSPGKWFLWPFFYASIHLHHEDQIIQHDTQGVANILTEMPGQPWYLLNNDFDDDVLDYPALIKALGENPLENATLEYHKIILAAIVRNELCDLPRFAQQELTEWVTRSILVERLWWKECFLANPVSDQSDDDKGRGGGSGGYGKKRARKNNQESQNV